MSSVGSQKDISTIEFKLQRRICVISTYLMIFAFWVNKMFGPLPSPNDGSQNYSSRGSNERESSDSHRVDVVNMIGFRQDPPTNYIATYSIRRSRVAKWLHAKPH